MKAQKHADVHYRKIAQATLVQISYDPRDRDIASSSTFSIVS